MGRIVTKSKHKMFLMFLCSSFSSDYTPDYLVVPNFFPTFVPLEPAKPLYNAQIGGSFFYYTYMKASFSKPYSSPEQIVQVLKSRGGL